MDGRSGYVLQPQSTACDRPEPNPNPARDLPMPAAAHVCAEFDMLGLAMAVRSETLSLWKSEVASTCARHPGQNLA